jgi:lipoprotein-anchoring transpeptidase ErfK/SrfK
VRRVLAIGLGLGLGAAAGAAALAATGDDPGAPAARGAPAAARPLPAAPRPALKIPAPTGLREEPDAAEWAPVRRAAVARARPAADGRRVARISTRTPEGTENLVRVLGRRTDGAGRVWVRVALAVLPNGTSGWVPRRAVGALEVVRERVVVDLRALRLTLYRSGRPVLRAPVAVGARRWPTPRGTFYVRNRLERYASPAYGPLAFGTSARSETLTDWPAGGFVGIHGTDRPDLVPGRVSHGCIRMRNADILRLARLMPVGTPVVIR